MDRNLWWHDVILNSFTLPVSQIYHATKDWEFSKLPPMRSSTTLRNSNKYCEYHRALRHVIEECRHLTEFILRLMMDGYLKEYLANQQKDVQKKSYESEYEKEPETLWRIADIHVAPASDSEYRNQRQERIRRAKHLYHAYKLSHEPRLARQGQHALGGISFSYAGLKNIDIAASGCSGSYTTGWQFRGENDSNRSGSRGPI